VEGLERRQLEQDDLKGVRVGPGSVIGAVLRHHQVAGITLGVTHKKAPVLGKVRVESQAE